MLFQNREARYAGTMMQKMPQDSVQDLPFVSEELTSRFLSTFHRLGGDITRADKPTDELELPSSTVIDDIICGIMEAFFPGVCGGPLTSRPFRTHVHEVLDALGQMLHHQVAIALAYREKCAACQDHKLRARDTILNLMDKLPDIRRLLKLDAQAGYEGDPAAHAIQEVIVAYPFLRTLAVHRVAHELYLMDVPLIPRMLSEKMHGQTGIDIHPGARIGESFFIDHGTGVVIGETAVIGNHVKLYQGVTLGALSFPKSPDGGLIKGIVRHPTVQDNVTIYAHATILGDITIGHDVVVGSNAWIKEDIPPFTRVTTEQPRLNLIPGHQKKK